MKDELVEVVAKAICEASSEQWRTGTYQLATGREFEFEDHDADALNNKWRYIAKNVIQALGKHLAENTRYTPTH